MTDNPEILLVDDEPSHRIIGKRALKRCFPQACINECGDLTSATKFIQNPNSNISVAIIDLNLEGHSGLELVRQLRAHPRFRDVPIIVNSTSQLEIDLYESYALGASLYIYKSDQPETFNSDLAAAVTFLLK